MAGDSMKKWGAAMAIHAVRRWLTRRSRRYREFELAAEIADRHDLRIAEGRRAYSQELYEAQQRSGYRVDPRS